MFIQFEKLDQEYNLFSKLYFFNNLLIYDYYFHYSNYFDYVYPYLLILKINLLSHLIFIC